MQHRLILPLLCCFAGSIAQNAHASRPSIRPRRWHLPRDGQHWTVRQRNALYVDAAAGDWDDATAVLNKPTTDPAILGRTSRLLDNINFRNGQPNTNGGFTFPTIRDEVVPASIPWRRPWAPTQHRPASARIFQRPGDAHQRTISFGVNCDDFCSLRIGKTVVVPLADERYSSRVIKQVMFKDAGLYPLEMVYYQERQHGLPPEVGADTAVPGVPTMSARSPDRPTTYAGQFKLVQRS